MRSMKVWCLTAIVVIYLTNLTFGDEPEIIIVGAGASGIAAASKLYENGFQNVKILEAENRIGGRINTTTWFDGGLTELGAEWVYGKTDNVVYELASPFRLLEKSSAKASFHEIYNSNGNKIPSSITNKFIGLWENLFETKRDNLEGSGGSSGDYYSTRMMATAMEFPEVNQTLIKEFINLAESLTKMNDGSDSWYDTSAREYVELWSDPKNGIIDWKDKGYKTIFDILVKKYPDPENELPVIDNTILNSEVIGINYGFIDGKVLVRSSNGEKYTADHVIMTQSLGVLKEQYKTLFQPTLPTSRIKAIKGLEMGTVAKIQFSFEKAWWPSNTEGFTYLWTESDRREYKRNPPKKWLLDQVGIYPSKGRPLILHTWVNGAGSRYMERLPEEDVIDQTFELLQKFLGKSYNVTRPTGLLRSTWYSNRHFRGAWSYRSMKTEEADVWATGLGTPLVIDDKPVVMFAGEATHPHYFASVHGAIETGFREANRLIRFYKNTRRSSTSSGNSISSFSYILMFLNLLCPITSYHIFSP